MVFFHLQINSLASSGGNNNVESVKNSTDELRKEVAKWTEILTMVEIRKGLEPSFVSAMDEPRESISYCGWINHFYKCFIAVPPLLVPRG